MFLDYSNKCAPVEPKLYDTKGYNFTFSVWCDGYAFHALQSIPGEVKFEWRKDGNLYEHHKVEELYAGKENAIRIYYETREQRPR